LNMAENKGFQFIDNCFWSGKCKRRELFFWRNDCPI